MDKSAKMVVAMVAVAALAFAMTVRAEEGKGCKKCPAGKEVAAKEAKGGADRGAAMFAKMDANSDGKVTKEEYVAAYEARAKDSGREAPPKEMIEKRFAKMDADSDGALTQEEMKSAHKKMMEEHGKGKGEEKKHKAE
jgi:hypothetical protein